MKKDLPRLHCPALHYTALRCTTLPCTALRCPALHYAALRCTATSIARLARLVPLRARPFLSHTHTHTPKLLPLFSCSSGAMLKRCSRRRDRLCPRSMFDVRCSMFDRGFACVRACGRAGSGIRDSN